MSTGRKTIFRESSQLEACIHYNVVSPTNFLLDIEFSQPQDPSISPPNQPSVIFPSPDFSPPLPTSPELIITILGPGAYLPSTAKSTSLASNYNHPYSCPSTPMRSGDSPRSQRSTSPPPPSHGLRLLFGQASTPLWQEHETVPPHKIPLFQPRVGCGDFCVRAPCL